MTKLEILRKFFAGRTDFYVKAFRDEKTGEVKTIHVKEPLTDEVLLDHIEGKYRVSVGLITKENKVFWGGYDIDGDDENHRKAVLLLHDACWNHGVPAFIYRTGGRGYRVVCFFDRAESELVFRFFHWIWSKVKNEIPEGAHVEIFPKQPRLSESAPFGSTLGLPFGVHPKTGNPAVFVTTSFEEIEDVESYFEAVTQVSQAQLEELEIPELPKLKPSAPVRPAVPDVLFYKPHPCVNKMLEKGIPQGKRNVCLFILACHLAYMGWGEWMIYNTVMSVNYGKCDPPLPEKEVVTLVRSALKKKYRKWGCDEPLWTEEFCGDEEKEKCIMWQRRCFPLEVIEWQRTRPSRYKVRVRLPDGQWYVLRRTFTVRSLLNKSEMEKAICDELGYCWKDLGVHLGGEDYKQAITSSIRQAQVQDVGEEGAEEAKLKEAVIEFLRSGLRLGLTAENIEEFKVGRLYLNQDHILFHLPPLHEQIRRKAKMSITRPDLISILRDIGAFPTREYVHGVLIRCWAIEKRKIEEE